MSPGLPSTALITGASSGLGAEFARQLSASGYELILVARREGRLQELANELKTPSGPSVYMLSADLSDQAGVERVANCIKERTNLEILVNNAGFGLSGEFSQANLERQLQMIRLHVIASVSLTHAALPCMMARKSGSIINVSSLAGVIPIRNVTYGSTKAYLIHFSRALQNELKDTGVHIQALCPGYILTEFHQTRDISILRRSQVPSFLWHSAEKVVAESLYCLRSGKVVCIPGTVYKFLAILGTNKITYPVLRALAARIF